MKPSLTGLDLESARVFALVLLSQGIEVVIEPGDNGFDLAVGDEHKGSALGVLELFYGENLTSGSRKKKAAVAQNIWGPVWVALVLGGVHWAADYYGVKQDLVLGCGSSALYILQGELYRTVTALFLHADLGHLVGNAAGMMIFGVPVCTLSGTLPGLMMILITGATGNLITALLYRTAHLSIGASTSVMGAAGILTAYQTIEGLRGRRGFHPGLLFPLGAGIALVGMLSGGENTDVVAHLAGFGAGLLMGSLTAVFRPDRA
jgi:membrane associated rhomboid family serine protease